MKRTVLSRPASPVRDLVPLGPLAESVLGEPAEGLILAAEESLGEPRGPFADFDTPFGRCFD